MSRKGEHGHPVHHRAGARVCFNFGGGRWRKAVHILHRGPDLYIFVTRGYFVARKASTTALFLHFLPSTRFFLYIQRELANTRLVKLY